MKQSYLYSSVNQSDITVIELELQRNQFDYSLQVKSEMGYSRRIIEVLHEAKDEEKITEILEKHEDEWSQIEVDVWLAEEKVQERHIEVITLMRSQMYSELDFYRGELFDAGIPSTIIEQRNMMIPNANVYLLQLGKPYLSAALAFLRGETENQESEPNEANENEENRESEPDLAVSDRQKTVELGGNPKSKAVGRNENIFGKGEHKPSDKGENHFEEILLEAREIEKKTASSQKISMIVQWIVGVFVLICLLLFGLAFFA